MSDGELFNQMADYYDIFRPDYPKIIADTIVDKANLTNQSKILEIGSGSGKATAMFVDFGIRVVCIEPGMDLIAKAKGKFSGKHVEFIASRFEEVSITPGDFDAIVSAQAFHWIEQPTGYLKCAELLKSNGCLAIFWNIDIYNDTEFDNELQNLLNRYDGQVSCATADFYTKRSDTIISGMAESGVFLCPELMKFIFDKSYTAEEYYGYMLTSQVFIQKPETHKKECYNELVKLTDKYGGIIKRQYVCELYYAKRKTKPLLM